VLPSQEGKVIRLSDIKIRIEQAADPEMERQALRALILSRLRIREKDLLEVIIVKKSIDARKKDDITYVYSVDVEVLNEKRVLGRSGSKAITPAPDLSYHEVQ
jgi:uncharacterized FAD-dependent dehydrogenase